MERCRFCAIVAHYVAMASPKKLTPPIAAAREAARRLHGTVRVDEYAWLQDKESAEVRAHIAAENAYADASLKGTAALQKKLYKEIRGRMKENDLSVPVKQGPYLYYTRTKKGKQYAIHCRKKILGGREGAFKTGPEEVILDENELAKGTQYFSLGTSEVSPDHTLLAYTTDTDGSERHTLYIKNLTTGALLDERVEAVSDIEWFAGGRHILYTLEEHPHPPRKVLVHELGTDAARDRLIFEEEDLQWYVAIDKSASEAHLFVISANFNTTEARVLPANDPQATLRLFAPRTREVKYFPEHQGDHFYILTNERAVNYKIMRTPVTAPEKRHWRPWMPHVKARAITGILSFDGFMAVTLREKGSEEIYVHAPGNPNGKKVALPEAEHAIGLWSNLEYASDRLRFSYQSFLTPNTVYDFLPATGELLARKRQEVPGWNPKQYVSTREWVKRGSVQVPVTLVYKKTTKRNGKAPLLLDCYGAYGITHDPYFSISRQSLLDRGWIVAFGHPRGGGEMGWHWHKEAKLRTKHRTYEDVIAIAEHLLRRKYTAKDRLALVGGSAGGMMVGAVLNLRPDLFGAAIAYVPAADTVTSMLDESLGGTRLHYDEVGDPRKRADYRYLLKWSPYEGVRESAYPPLLVRANMNDIRTPYWEAAKWVARLRAKKTDANPLYLKTETVAGHFGKSGRYEWIRDRAFDFAFLMTVIRTR